MRRYSKSASSYDAFDRRDNFRACRHLQIHHDPGRAIYFTQFHNSAASTLDRDDALMRVGVVGHRGPKDQIFVFIGKDSMVSLHKGYALGVSSCVAFIERHSNANVRVKDLELVDLFSLSVKEGSSPSYFRNHADWPWIHEHVAMQLATTHELTSILESILYFNNKCVDDVPTSYNCSICEEELLVECNANDITAHPTTAHVNIPQARICIRCCIICRKVSIT